MDGTQAAQLIAERNAEIALLLMFLSSRPLLMNLCGDADIVLSIRKGHVLPTVRIEDRVSVKLKADPDA